MTQMSGHENILSDRGAVFTTTAQLPIATVGSLNSGGSEQVQILLAVCRKFAMVRISDCGLSWKRGYMVLIGQPFRNNNLSPSSQCHVCCSFLSVCCLMIIQHKNVNKIHFFITQYLGNQIGTITLYLNQGKNLFNVRL